MMARNLSKIGNDTGRKGRIYDATSPFLRGLSLFSLLFLWTCLFSGSPARAETVDSNTTLLAPSKERALAIPHHLTLLQAMEITIDRHPQYKQALHTAQANKEVIGEAFSNYLPHLSAGAGYNFETGNFVISPGIPASFYAVLPANSNQAYNFYQASFSLTQTIYTFGQRVTQLRQAKYSYKASLDQARWTLVNLLYGVETAYDTFAQNLLLVGAAKKTVDDYTAQLQVAQAEFQIGMAAKFDVLNARVNLSNAKLNLITAENNVSTARVALNNAMGIETNEQYTVDTDLSVVPFDADSTKLVRMALENRPDLSSAMNQKLSDLQNERYYESTYMPSIGMTGGYTYASMFFPLTYNWSAGATISIPIFSGFLTVHQERQAQKTTLAARDAEQNVRVGIVSAIHQDVDNLRTASQRISTTRDLLSQAKESLRLAAGQYQVGVGSAVALTQAEADLAAARAQVVSAVYGYKIARAALIKDAGLDPLSQAKRRKNTEERKK